MTKAFSRVALISAAALISGSAAQADHSWGNYHWARTSNPVTLKINTALSGQWPGIMQTAMEQWDDSTVLAFTKSGTSYLFPSGRSPKQCNPIAGQILVCNAPYGQRGWLGIASIWANGDHITQGTTKLNDTYFNMAKYNTPYWRAMVGCQEVGHDFGLGHVNETFTDKNTGSCMDYTNDPSGVSAQNGPLENDAPNAHDLSWLEAMYAHTDSTNTSSASSPTNFGVREVGRPVAAPPRGYAGAGDTAAEWGAAVRRDSKGRPDQFVRRLPDGTLMITHVLWTPDAKGTEAGPVHEEDGHTH